jgi:hypothetical protein
MATTPRVLRGRPAVIENGASQPGAIADNEGTLGFLPDKSTNTRL